METNKLFLINDTLHNKMMEYETYKTEYENNIYKGYDILEARRDAAISLQKENLKDIELKQLPAELVIQNHLEPIKDEKVNKETKVVMHNCFWFKCDKCKAINICDLDKYESLYICDICDKTCILTGDDTERDGIMIQTGGFTIKGELNE